jgi:hypothetical protein
MIEVRPPIPTLEESRYGDFRFQAKYGTLMVPAELLEAAIQSYVSTYRMSREAAAKHAIKVQQWIWPSRGTRGVFKATGFYL